MRRAVLTIIGMLVAAAAVTAQANYGSGDVKAFRESRDREFRSKDSTPLTDRDLASFDGLSYFEIDPKFSVDAKLERNAGTETFLMTTSAGTTRKYLKFGTLRFEIDGAPYSLTVFRSESAPKLPEYAGLLFLPFRDLTNGKESYGAGRYLDLRIPDGDSVKLDFNLAYNPSCAYGSDRFSCPLPPRENFLQIKIFAGERNFEHPAEK